MHRLLRELDRIDAGARPRRTGGRGVLAAFVGLALLALGGCSFVYQHPEALHFLHRHLRSAPPAVVDGGGTFKYIAHQPGARNVPVTYNPCRPIEIEVNDDLAPAGAESFVREAIARVTAATGLHFTIVGRSDDTRATRRARTPWTGVPRRRRPALLVWSNPSIDDKLSGRVAGVGGSTQLADDMSGASYYATGVVALDAPDFRNILSRPGGHAEARAIVMHELGHLVGLAHVHDPHELMNERNVGQLDFGPGDLRGLAALGAGPCIGLR